MHFTVLQCLEIVTAAAKKLAVVLAARAPRGLQAELADIVYRVMRASRERETMERFYEVENKILDEASFRNTDELILAE